MHGVHDADKRKRVTAIVGLLDKLGYPEILHIESGARIDPGNAEAAREGHLYVRHTPQ